ncbi:MAG: 3-phosphoserine/phosphohydroxythreonine transaminase [Candidatus Zixiibacteriota bacterium]
MMSQKIYNFNAGPAILPHEVLVKAQKELLNYNGIGMSVMEISHRTKEYEEINDVTIALFRELMGLGPNHKVIFLGGGASTQFAMLPMNLLSQEKTAAYVETGSWAEKAIKEAKKFGNVHVAASSKDKNYSYIPKLKGSDVPDDSVYLHITSNNTIFGTQWHEFPNVSVPLVCDMSSDILSRQLNFKSFDMIYAGAQKNVGPAGVTIVIIKDDLLEKCSDSNPVMFNYKTHAAENSLYNTPPVFPIYMVKLVLEWMKAQGGLSIIEGWNRAKQEVIYDIIGQNSDYYKGHAQRESRSWMNITFRLPSPELEEKFTKESQAAGFIGLKGHRSVGGIRVSLYNAMPIEGAEKLAEFMQKFRRAN